MTKQGGLGAQLWVSGYDLGDDIGSVNIACPSGTFDKTPITKFANARIYGRRDGSMSVQVFFDPVAGRAHSRFKLLPTADQLMTFGVGTALGNPAAALWSKQINYDPTRTADGDLTFASEAQGNGYGLEWGVQLTAGSRTDTGATAGTAVDLGTASPGAFGAQFYLHVLSFTGTDATIKIQESSDNAGDAYADVVGGGFTVVTAGPTYQRIATAAINVERYLKVVTTTSGGFTSLVFQVTGNRNPVLTAF